MSERGLAKLLEIRHSALQSMATTGLPKTVNRLGQNHKNDT